MSAAPAVAAAPRPADARPGSVTVRFSRSEEDIAARVSLARRAYEEMGDKALPFDGELVRRGVVERLAKPGRYCLVQAERGERTVGMLSAAVGPHWYSSAPGASILAFYVLPEHRGSLAAIKLLHACRRWAGERGAVRLHVNVASGVDIARTDRLLKRLGFRLTGGNYELAL